MRVKVERSDVVEQAQLVEVAEGRERRNRFCAFHNRWAKSVLIDDRDIERFHQRARVLAEALLARHEVL